ncbi:MAG: type IV secretory system conjugative DNA transfer family protein [Clostridiales bacterium]|nr:type IV secretory system conjugative DNA transfer family protein [Clostridiales bacterium]
MGLVLALVFFYIAGIIAQFLNNRHNWSPGKLLHFPSLNPLTGFVMLFTPFGLQAVIGLFLVSVIAVLLFWMNREDNAGMIYDKARNFWYSKKGVYGTAGWMSEKEMKTAFNVTPEENIENIKELIYGCKDGKLVSRPTDCMLNRHVAVMGSSGSMKSRTISRGVLFSAVQQGHSVVVTDPKGELATEFYQYFIDNGYYTQILNTVDPYSSGRFDGLEGALERQIFVANIVESIIMNTGGGIGEPIYDDAEGALLTALIFLQFEREKSPTIKGAYHVLLETATADELDNYFAGLEKGSRARQSYNLFRKASPNMQGNICLGLGTRLSVLQNEEIADLMCGNDMDLQLLGKQKCAYFLILSDQDKTTQFISATFFSLLFLRLVEYADNFCEDKKLPVPVTLLLDEFCSIVGSINAFPQKLSNIRSRNIHCTLVFQQLGQLMNRFPDNLWSEILGNCDVIMCLGCSSDPVTAKFISDRSGEVTIYADTVMSQRNVYTPSMFNPNFRHSEGAGRRKLLTYDEVMRMERSKMLVMVNGQQILMLEKFDYTRNPECGKLKPIPVRGLAHVNQAASTDIHEAIEALDCIHAEKNSVGQNTGGKDRKPVSITPMGASPSGKDTNKKSGKGVRKNVANELPYQIRFEDMSKAEHGHAGTSAGPSPEHNSGTENSGTANGPAAVSDSGDVGPQPVEIVGLGGKPEI